MRTHTHMPMCITNKRNCIVLYRLDNMFDSERGEKKHQFGFRLFHAVTARRESHRIHVSLWGWFAHFALNEANKTSTTRTKEANNDDDGNDDSIQNSMQMWIHVNFPLELRNQVQVYTVDIISLNGRLYSCIYLVYRKPFNINKQISYELELFV